MNTKGDTEPKTTKPPAKPEANSNKQKSGNALLGLFVFLTFLLAVAGIGAGYYVWQQTQLQLQATKAEFKALEHELSIVDENPRIQQFSRSFGQKIEATNSSLKNLSKSIQSITNEQTRLNAAVQETSDVVNRGQKDWMLKEVDHVLRMSQHRLLLDRDFASALAGLNAADNRLNDINDVRLIPVRQSISRQIQALNQFPHPDYVGIQLKLDNVMANLKNSVLKQISTQIAEDKSSESGSDSNSEIIATSNEPFDWQKVLQISKQFVFSVYDKTKAALSDSINITRGEQKIALFIEEQEKKRAYDFLRNKLLGAKYAVSTHDDLAFHQQLSAASAWLENNDQFSGQASLAQEIEQLNKINLMPSLPDISEPSILLAKHVDSFKDKK